MSATAGVDPDLVALAGLRLGALLLATAWPSADDPRWHGPAARAADAVAGQARAGYQQARLVLAETAAALAATADALAAGVALVQTADRLTATIGLAGPTPAPGEDPTDAALLRAVTRLQADAAAQLAAADRLCASRLQALLALPLRPLPPLRPPVTPEQAAIGAEQRAGWAAVPAPLLGAVAALTAGSGAAAGGPAPAREIAAQLVVAADHPLLLDPEADGTDRHYLEAGAGDVAEVWGDIAGAHTVVVLVPGTTTDPDHFGSAQQQGDAVYDGLRLQAGPDVAVVSWLGSPEPTNVAEAAEQGWAKRAAPRLRAFVDALPLAVGARLTLIGHSYGAVVAGLAVRAGLRPAALIGVAPAGFGPGVHTAADLGGVPVFVVEDGRDPIRDEYLGQGAIQVGLDLGLGPVVGTLIDRATGVAGIGHLGDDPRGMPGTTELASRHDAFDCDPLPLHLAIHESYFLPGSATLRELVAVATARPAATGSSGTCARWLSLSDVQPPHSRLPGSSPMLPE